MLRAKKDQEAAKNYEADGCQMPWMHFPLLCNSHSVSVSMGCCNVYAYFTGVDKMYEHMSRVESHVCVCVCMCLPLSTGGCDVVASFLTKLSHLMLARSETNVAGIWAHFNGKKLVERLSGSWSRKTTPRLYNHKFSMELRLVSESFWTGARARKTGTEPPAAVAVVDIHMLTCLPCWQ